MHEGILSSAIELVYFFGYLYCICQFVAYMPIMINIAESVDEIFRRDDVAMAAARRGLLNLSAYARQIRPEIQTVLLKDVSEGSIVTAMSRLVSSLPQSRGSRDVVLQALAVHANLAGVSYGRSHRVSEKIRGIYQQVTSDTRTFLTITQGINE